MVFLVPSQQSVFKAQQCHHFQAIKVAEKIASFSVPAVQLAKAMGDHWADLVVGYGRK